MAVVSVAQVAGGQEKGKNVDGLLDEKDPHGGLSPPHSSRRRVGLTFQPWLIQDGRIFTAFRLDHGGLNIPDPQMKPTPNRMHQVVMKENLICPKWETS